MTPDDYRCKLCGNLVLYRIDHKITCVHYPHPQEEPHARN